MPCSCCGRLRVISESSERWIGEPFTVAMTGSADAGAAAAEAPGAGLPGAGLAAGLAGAAAGAALCAQAPPPASKRQRMELAMMLSRQREGRMKTSKQAWV